MSAESVASDAEELWAWVAEVQRRGLRLYVTGTNGALHEFRVPAARIDGYGSDDAQV